MRQEHRNNSPTTTGFGLHHAKALNNWAKWFDSRFKNVIDSSQSGFITCSSQSHKNCRDISNDWFGSSGECRV